MRALLFSTEFLVGAVIVVILLGALVIAVLAAVDRVRSRIGKS